MAEAGGDRAARVRLGAALRDLRTAAGLRQVDAAAKVEISQDKLSRAERGDAVLLPDQVAALVRLYDAEPAEADRIVAMGEEISAARADQRIVFQSGNTVDMQRRYARLEDEAAHVRGYQPVMVLGSMQTPAYAATVFGVDEDDPNVAQRLGRQDRIFAEPGRRWTLVQTEGSLRWQARSAQVMAEQVERLIEISHSPNVDLGIVDWRTPITVFPSTAFHLYDETAAVIGIRGAAAIIEDPARLRDYRELFEQICGLASFGDDARATLRRIADEYRALGPAQS